MVIDALSSCVEWEDASADQISIIEVSGEGGNRTYKVTRSVDDSVVGQVAFHLVGKTNNFENQPDFLAVQKSATAAFASADLGPQRLADKGDIFFINQWFRNS